MNFGFVSFCYAVADFCKFKFYLLQVFRIFLGAASVRDFIKLNFAKRQSACVLTNGPSLPHHSLSVRVLLLLIQGFLLLNCQEFSSNLP